MVNRTEPTHNPGPRTKAMCEIAARYGIEYYSALDGDAWSPDLPGLIEYEIEQRLTNFAQDCANRGLTDWRKEAILLGHHSEHWSE